MNFEPSNEWLIDLIGIIIGLILITLFVLIGYRLHFMISASRIRQFELRLMRLISCAVNSPEKSNVCISDISILVQQNWQYEILLNYLTLMCYSFSGVYETRTKELYAHFNLAMLSERKLKSKKWYLNVQGIIELSIIGGAGSYKKIIPFLEHENWYVRKQSKIAIVELGKAQGLVEMESKMGTMSRWTFISVLSILHRSAFKVSSENLALLRKSKNPSMKKLIPHLEAYATIYS